MLSKSGKQPFNNGVLISVRMKHCNEYKGEILSMICNNQINENKKFEANFIF